MRRTMRLFVMAALLSGALNVAAAPAAVSPELAEKFPLKNEAAQILLEENFNRAPDRLLKGWTFDAHAGTNGTGALRYTLPPGTQAINHAIPLPELQTETLYRLSVKIRIDRIDAVGKADHFGGLCVEFMQDGKWFGGVYPKHLPPSDGQWHALSMDFALKTGATAAKAVLYLRKPYTGDIFFDELRLTSRGDPEAAIVPLRPAGLTFRVNQPEELVVSARVRGSVKPALLVKTIDSAAHTRLFLWEPSSDGRFRGTIPGAPAGPLNFRFRLLDPARQTALLEADFQAHVSPPTAPPAAATVDEQQRLLVHGQPFMPIGIYTTRDTTSLQRIAATEIFNTVVIYDSLGLNKETAGARIPAIRAALDRIGQMNLKLIFVLKDQYEGQPAAYHKLDNAIGAEAVALLAVTELRDHPALLGWNISDEDARSRLPVLQRRREKITAVDPHHPVFTLTYRPEDFPAYAVSGDLTMFDDYPVRAGGPTQLTALMRGWRSLERAGVPGIAVVQAFNWGTYKAKDQADYDRNYRFPSAADLRAMTLYPAIAGARGFIFYSDFDIWKRSEKFAPGSAPREWQKLLDIAGFLRTLEPWIMSTVPRTEISVQCTGAPIRATRLKAEDGREIILIAAAGPGSAHGTFALPSGTRWRSQFGLVSQQSDGQWHFQAGGADADVLWKIL